MRKTSNLVYFSFLTVLLLANCKCKKDPDPMPITPAIPLQDLAAYSFFKTGTYWIYKDSASGIEDSVYVYSDTLYTYYNPGTPNVVLPGNYKYYEYKAHSSYDLYNYYYKIDFGYYGGNKVPVWRLKTKPSDYVGESFLMHGNFTPGAVLYAYTSPGSITFRQNFDSFQADTLTFTSVVHFTDSQNASENFFDTTYGSINPTTEYYIAKNIGIVKRTIYDAQFNTINKTDLLIRYNIIQ